MEESKLTKSARKRAKRKEKAKQKVTEEAIEIVEEVAKETASKVSDNFSEEFANKLVRQGSKEVPPVTQETAAGNTEAVVDDIVSEVASEVANQPPASEAVQDSVTTLERPTDQSLLEKEIAAEVADVTPEKEAVQDPEAILNTLTEKEKGPLERDFAVEAANQVPATEAVSNPVTAQDKPPEKGKSPHEMEAPKTQEDAVKTKEEIIRERQAKKAEKAAAKKAKKPDAPPPSNPKDKENAGPAETEGKSKAELRKERQAKQDAQRAAKAQQQAAAASAPTARQQRVPTQMQADRPSVERKLARQLASQQVPQLPPAQRKVQLFSHLQQQERKLGIGQLTRDLAVNQERIHPAIISLGLQYASGVVCGSNARAVALLTALKRVIADYSTPPDKELWRHLDDRLKPCISFLEGCRPKSVSMGNAIRYVKRQISTTAALKSEGEAKRHLYDMIDRFVDENVELAGKAISEQAGNKIAPRGDVLLTFGASSLVARILLDAHAQGKQFRVIVLDARPHCEGLHTLRRLASAGVKVSYLLVSAAPYVMPEVTKVLLGAHALLANGNVMSRVGASQVSLVARAHNVPVLVCCETYKFCERVQTDSFVFNELGDPEDLVSSSSSSIANWRDKNKLFLLNLRYDVTPADLVTAVITELAVLPCTSVPVVLRVKNAEHFN